MRLSIPGEPIPASRARVRAGQGGYHTPRYAEWLRDARWVVRDQYRGPVLTGMVQVRIQTFGARANADVDNLAKGVLDSMQGIVFSDDRQVEHLAITRIPAKTDKRVEVEVL